MTETPAPIRVEAVVTIEIPAASYREFFASAELTDDQRKAIAEVTDEEIDAAQNRVIELYYQPIISETVRLIMSETVGYLMYGEVANDGTSTRA